jgi:tRNA(Ile)-lysidine synthase
MGNALELAFRRAAGRLIDSRKRWLVAVSGGGDSIALLHLMNRLFDRSAGQLIVAHLDHGLRRGSRTDRTFVERRALELGLDIHTDLRDVGKSRRRDESPEEAARRVRREFLLETAKRFECDGIVTGHTLDDQAETVLMRLARGAGAAGLAGIPESAGPFVRPLLGLERAALREWLLKHKLTWREDPSNRDLRFDRNRVRRRLIPLLEKHLNPRAARHLAHAASVLRDDAAYLDRLADQHLGDASRTDREGRPILRVELVRSFEPVIARRVALAALKRAGVDARRIGRKHVEALLDLAAPPGNREIHLPGKLTARRVRGEIRFGPRIG